MTYGACGKIVNHRDIPVSERGKTFRIRNNDKSRVIIVQVDGCMMKQIEACDYLFDVAKNNTIYYVELKGKNIEKAVKQLLSTMRFFKSTHQDKSKEFHIVASRVPGTTAQNQKLLREFRSETGFKLIIKSSSQTISV